ncbi:MAG: MarR family transcriptional regulator [Saprospiraceae bacterium]|nr:MarR family transcriptional regulator [Saprospiraceae bacterium]
MDITIDQWLVLKSIRDNPDLTQKEIAEKVFKDHASITRIIELLVKKEYLVRSFHGEDRRRFQLELTATGIKTYEKLVPIVSTNRARALQGLTEKEINSLFHLLQKIAANCTENIA